MSNRYVTLTPPLVVKITDEPHIIFNADIDLRMHPALAQQSEALQAIGRQEKELLEGPTRAFMQETRLIAEMAPSAASDAYVQHAAARTQEETFLMAKIAGSLSQPQKESARDTLRTALESGMGAVASYMREHLDMPTSGNFSQGIDTPTGHLGFAAPLSHPSAAALLKAFQEAGHSITYYDGLGEKDVPPVRDTPRSLAEITQELDTGVTRALTYLDRPKAVSTGRTR